MSEQNEKSVLDLEEDEMAHLPLLHGGHTEYPYQIISVDTDAKGNVRISFFTTVEDDIIVAARWTATESDTAIVDESGA